MYPKQREDRDRSGRVDAMMRSVRHGVKGKWATGGFPQDGFEMNPFRERNEDLPGSCEREQQEEGQKQTDCRKANSFRKQARSFGFMKSTSGTQQGLRGRIPAQAASFN